MNRCDNPAEFAPGGSLTFPQDGISLVLISLVVSLVSWIVEAWLRKNVFKGMGEEGKILKEEGSIRVKKDLFAIPLRWFPLIAVAFGSVALAQSLVTASRFCVWDFARSLPPLSLTFNYDPARSYWTLFMNPMAMLLAVSGASVFANYRQRQAPPKWNVSWMLLMVLALFGFLLLSNWPLLWASDKVLHTSDVTAIIHLSGTGIFFLSMMAAQAIHTYVAWKLEGRFSALIKWKFIWAILTPLLPLIIALALPQRLSAIAQYAAIVGVMAFVSSFSIDLSEISVVIK